MRERIGVVGLGRMGWALAERFAGQGCEVVGWTRSGFESSKAEESGFAPSETLGELVSSSDIVFLSLFDEIAVRDVLGQLAVLDLERKLIVETSTVSPNVCRQLESSINAAGGALIDAPISGGPEMVRSGDMGLFIGGSDVDVARFMPVAELGSNRIAHVGPLGAGAAMKIVNNVALAGAFQAACEALELGDAMGLDLATMLPVLAAGPGTTPMFKARVGKISGEDKEVGFALNGVVKDGAVFLGAARDHGVETPAMAALAERAQDAFDAGFGDEDAAVMIRHRLGLT